MHNVMYFVRCHSIRVKTLTLLAGMLSCFVSCADSDAEQQAARVQARRQFVADSLALKVAVTPTLDCLPLFLAADEGWFKREGVEVLLRPYQAQFDQDTALLRGHVEGMTTDSIRTAWIREQGMDVKTVATTSLKWQLISNKTARIRQLRQLDDKMVAMTRRSATDWLAQHVVDSVGLAPERVFRIQVNDIGVRLSMLQNGIMDAMFLPEPQATVARLDGHPTLLDTDSMGVHLGVIVFSREALADTMRQRQIAAFTRVYNMAADTIARQGLKAYRKLIAQHCHVAPAVADSIDVK